MCEWLTLKNEIKNFLRSHPAPAREAAPYPRHPLQAPSMRRGFSFVAILIAKAHDCGVMSCKLSFAQRETYLANSNAVGLTKSSKVGFSFGSKHRTPTAERAAGVELDKTNAINVCTPKVQNICDSSNGAKCIKRKVYQNKSTKH